MGQGPKSIAQRYLGAISYTRLILANIKWAVFGRISRPGQFNPLINTEIFFIESHDRGDLRKETALLKASLGPNVLSVVVAHKTRAFNLKNSFIAFFLIVINIKSVLSATSSTTNSLAFIQKALLVSECFQALSHAIDLFPFYARSKSVFSFQEVTLTENIVCQVANGLGLRTYAFQHAISLGLVDRYLDRTRSKPTHLDDTILEASVCNVVFCWGNIQRDLFKAFTRAHPVVIGRASLDAATQAIRSSPDGITFIFDSDCFNSERLMELVRKSIFFGFPVSLWFKPKTEHSRVFSAERIGPLRRFVIGGKSSLLPQLAVGGSSVFILSQSYFERFLPPNLIIHDFDDLVKAYTAIDSYRGEVWQDFIAYTGVTTLKKLQAFVFSHRNDEELCEVGVR